MTLWNRILAVSGTAAFAAAVAFGALAQDEAAPAAEGEAAAPAAEAEAAEAPAAEVKPLPSEIMPLSVKSLLLDVVKADGQLVTVGDRGNILLSSDGKQWTQVQAPVRSALTAVHFPDAQHGWAVGHDATIVATKDAGKTWTLQHFAPALEKPFLDVLFLDASHGFAVGAYGLLMQTTDGGQTWSDAGAATIQEEELHFNGITKLGNGDLFIAGESGMLGISSDQGKTWKKLASPYESTLFGVLPVGQKGALIFGLRGNVYLSQDARAGGWKKVDSGTVASMFGGTVLPDGNLALVGLNGVILLVSPDGKVRALQTPMGTPLASALPMADGLLIVGESGVQQQALN